MAVHDSNGGGPIHDPTLRARVTENSAKHASFVVEECNVANSQVDTDRLGTRPQNRERLRVNVLVDKEALRLRL